MYNLPAKMKETHWWWLLIVGNTNRNRIEVKESEDNSPSYRLEDDRLCGVTAGGTEECNWDCKLGFQGYVIEDPSCIKDCFKPDHCVNHLIDDYVRAGGICDDKNGRYKDFFPAANKTSCTGPQGGACLMKTIEKCEKDLKSRRRFGVGRVMEDTIDILWATLCNKTSNIRGCS